MLAPKGQARQPKGVLGNFHPPVKTGGIKIGKDKRKGSEHHKGPIDKEAASRN